MNKFLKRHYAMLLFAAFFAIWAGVFILRYIEFYEVRIDDPIQLESIGEIKDGQPVYFSDRNLPKVEKDITDRFESPEKPPPQFKICWQCEKKIPKDKTVCPLCGAIQTDTDTDKDGMPDHWELRFRFNPEEESDSLEDADGDKYSNLDEYKGGTNPRDPASNPMNEKIGLSVVSIYRKPVEILFRGYMEKDGEYTLTINWEVAGGSTHFVKPGDILQGYEIIDFRKIIETRKLKKQGVVKEEDRSYITLRDPMGQPFRLVINNIYVAKELYARLKDNALGTVFNDLRVGSVFDLEIDETPIPFTVISLFPDEITIRSKSGTDNTIAWRE